MGEAHVHNFINMLLKREVIVIDVRKRYLAMVHYPLGWEVQRQISMREAKEIRARNCEAMPYWLLMSPGHLSALQLI